MGMRQDWMAVLLPMWGLGAECQGLAGWAGKVHSHFLAAIVRPLHPVACLQKVEESFRRNSRVGVASKGHNLP